MRLVPDTDLTLFLFVFYAKERYGKPPISFIEISCEGYSEFGDGRHLDSRMITALPNNNSSVQVLYYLG
jgi:hypothetical protein